MCIDFHWEVIRLRVAAAGWGNEEAFPENQYVLVLGRVSAARMNDMRHKTLVIDCTNLATDQLVTGGTAAACHVLWPTSQRSITQSIYSIDYRYEDVRFQVSASCITISNLDLFSSSETGVNPAIRSWKITFLIEHDVRKPLLVSISQRSEELRLYNLV